MSQNTKLVVKCIAKRLHKSGMTYRQLDRVLFNVKGNGTKSFRLLSK